MKFTAIKILVIIIALLWVTSIIFKCSGKKDQQIPDRDNKNEPNAITVRIYGDEKEIIKLYNCPEETCKASVYSLFELIANPML